MNKDNFRYGLRENIGQVAHQLIQVTLVGFAIGMTRTVIPVMAESEFGLERGSFMVLLWGWVIALPIPVMIWYAPNWNWIVAATVLLGVNQGLCWSMTQTAKLDITRAEERGLTMGLNEFSGYVGVALAGILTAYAAEWLGARTGLLIFAGADCNLGERHATLGRSRDCRAQGCTAKEPTALSPRRRGAPHNIRGLRNDELA